MPKTIFLNEEQVNLLQEYNSPDKVFTKHKNLRWNDGDAITFLLLDDNTVVCQKGLTHGDLVNDLVAQNLGFKDNFDFMNYLKNIGKIDNKCEILEKFNDLGEDLYISSLKGRYWSDFNIISFWDGVPMVNKIYMIVDGIQKTLSININKETLRIALEHKCIFVNQLNNDNEIEFDKEMQNSALKLHLMKADDKINTTQMQQYLHNRSENIGKKLSYSNRSGEMPMAQYRALHTTSENVEKDKYMLGDEGDGNLGYIHIEEGYGQKRYFDKDSIDRIEYMCTEADPEEGEDENMYEVDCYDSYGTLIYSDMYLTFDELWDILGSNLATMISNDANYKSGEWNQIDDIIATSQGEVDDTDVNQVNTCAKRLFETSDEYLGGDRGYILIDGTVLEFGPNIDHASISSVGNQTIGSFLSLGNIRIGEQSMELATEPTFAQRKQIRKLIQYYNNSEIYVDIIKYNGDGMYGTTISSARYESPTFNKVIGEIDRYFNEGIKLRGGYCGDEYDDIYEGKKLVREDFINQEGLTENVQYEVEPEEVDLSSFGKKNELNPQIWKNEKTIDSRVRLQLLDIADDFYDSLEVSFVEPKDIILTGSICNFNWSDKSDIDLHIVLDFKEIGENASLIEDYFNTKKNEWNQNHQNLQIFGFNVEVYVEDVNATKVSNGVYSLEKNEWIKKPNFDEVDDIEPMSQDLKVLSSKLMTCIDDLKDEFNRTNDSKSIEDIRDTLDYIWGFVKMMRKESLSKKGEYSKGNIIYKILRRNGYLDQIFSLSNDIYDKLNSIS